MHTPFRRAIGLVLLLAACGGSAVPACAGGAPFALGGVYGLGNGTNIYGVQAVWAPPIDSEFLDRHELGLRLTAQVSRWIARDNEAQYHSLTDGNVMAEFRYLVAPMESMQPFVEAGLGFHLLSHVHVAERDMTTAFNFGTQAALGVTFGDNGRYEIAGLIHHASNARIKQPNNGMTYGGVRFRVAFP